MVKMKGGSETVVPATPKDNTEPDREALSKLATENVAPVDAAPAPASGVPPVEPRKRGRPKGSKNAPAVPALTIPRTIVADVLRAPYSAAAAQLGKHWELSAAEADGMVDSHLALLQRYAPEFLKNHPELATVLILHGMAILARLSIHYKIQREQVESETPVLEVVGETGEVPPQPSYSSVRPQ